MTSQKDVMLKIGDYKFSIASAAYQTLERTSKWAWGRTPRIGGPDALQFVGISDVIKLDGVIHAEFAGGKDQLNAMRAEADKAEPLLLVDGLGNIHGNWVITSIIEKQSKFLNKGTPITQNFTMEIQYYDGASKHNSVFSFVEFKANTSEFNSAPHYKDTLGIISGLLSQGKDFNFSGPLSSLVADIAGDSGLGSFISESLANTNLSVNGFNNGQSLLSGLATSLGGQLTTSNGVLSLVDSGHPLADAVANFAASAGAQYAVNAINTGGAPQRIDQYVNFDNLQGLAAGVTAALDANPSLPNVPIDGNMSLPQDTAFFTPTVTAGVINTAINLWS